MVHADLLALPARRHIADTLDQAARATGPLETNPWGKIRGSQMTVSRLG
jgi:hypothetical protein